MSWYVATYSYGPVIFGLVLLLVGIIGCTCWRRVRTRHSLRRVVVQKTTPVYVPRTAEWIPRIPRRISSTTEWIP